jgi:hypothetical protein
MLMERKGALRAGPIAGHRAKGKPARKMLLIALMQRLAGGAALNKIAHHRALLSRI